MAVKTPETLAFPAQHPCAEISGKMRKRPLPMYDAHIRTTDASVAPPEPDPKLART